MKITQCKLYNTPNVSSDHMSIAQTFKKEVWFPKITLENVILSI